VNQNRSLNADDLDAQIREALRENHPQALELIWDGYADTLYGLVLSIVCSTHLTEDVMQNVFLKIARNRTRVRKARRLRPYIFRIARNEAFDTLKRRRREPAFDPETPWLAVEAAPELHGEAERASRLLEMLPHKQRTVLVLKIYRELTFAEIAATLGISPNTAASRYRYGIERLRSRLERR
jgi:RNA polymerase sigma-70 factor, ECF subfamily